jgi:hypothetical protein
MLKSIYLYTAVQVLTGNRSYGEEIEENSTI